jgi:hypothetical protein
MYIWPLEIHKLICLSKRVGHYVVDLESRQLLIYPRTVQCWTYGKGLASSVDEPQAIGLSRSQIGKAACKVPIPLELRPSLIHQSNRIKIAMAFSLSVSEGCRAIHDSATEASHRDTTVWSYFPLYMYSD